MITELIGAGEVSQAALQQISGELNSLMAPSGNAISTCTVAQGDARKLKAALNRAMDRSELIIVIGGLGPGADGISKQVLVDLLGRKLVLHKESLTRIEQAYAKAGRKMPDGVERLAAVPEKSVVFPGQRGITPGCAVSLGKVQVVLLPGAEKECIPMVTGCLLPYLDKLVQSPQNVRIINLFGLTAEEAHAIITAKYALLRNPTVAVKTVGAELQVEISTRAHSKVEAAAISSPVIKELLGAFGEYAFGVDQENLPTVAVGALGANRLTLAVAESGTDGLLGRLVEGVNTPSRTLKYSETFNSNRAKSEKLDIPPSFLKKHGESSPHTAAAMAKGAMDAGKADIGLAITGNTDENLFAVAVCDHSSVWVAKVDAAKDTDSSSLRRYAVLWALDLCRRVVAELPKRYHDAIPLQMATSGKLPKLLEATMPAEGTAVPAKHKKNKKNPKKQKEKRGFLSGVFPGKGDSFGEVLRKLLLIIAVSTFLCSAAYLGAFYYQAFSNRVLSQEMASQYEAGILSGGKLTIPDNYPKDYQRKFGNLYGINPDVGGWLEIPDTQVNYPVVYYTADNEYYMRRDFTKKSNRHGVPWIDSQCTLNPQSDNYIIYGHNMTDGQMFGELAKYKPSSGNGLEFLQAHPIITMNDVYRDNSYKILSVFITNAKTSYGDIFNYNLFTDLSNSQNFNAFVQEVTERSFYTSNVDVQQGDQFITLSTCSYEYGAVSDDSDVRTVIVGRRLRKGEKSDGSDILYQVNASPKVPQGFKKELEAGAHTGPTAQYITASVEGTTQTAQSTSPNSVKSSSSAVPAMAAPVTKTPDMDQVAKDVAIAASQAAKATSDAQASTAASSGQASQTSAKSAVLAASDVSSSQTTTDADASEAAASKAASDAAAASKAASDAAASSKAASDAAAAKTASLQAAMESEMARKQAQAERLAEEMAEKEAAAEREAAEEAARKKEQEKENQQNSSNTNRNPSGSGSDSLTISSGGKISGTAAELVPQIVMAEMGSSFQTEALKAQAVAVYSFVKQQNASGVIPYFNTKTPSADVKRACESVLGEAVYYGGSISFTPFYATSAGVTVASSDVWGGSYSYLTSVDSSVDSSVSTFEKSDTYTADEVAQRVSKSMNIDLYEYSNNPDDWFRIESYTPGDQYVKKISVGSKSTTGRAFREQVMNLRSAAFDISFDGSRFTFTTRGYGHGVGLSQTGANEYAKQGWNYVDILEHYYPGTQVR